MSAHMCFMVTAVLQDCFWGRWSIKMKINKLNNNNNNNIIKLLSVSFFSVNIIFKYGFVTLTNHFM